MHLTINGRFLTQGVTGVQRYGREILAALDQQLTAWPDWTAEILTPRHEMQAPVLANIRLRTVGRLRGHAWEQLELPIYMQGNVLFCPANTAPLMPLVAGRQVVVTVHDLSYLYFPEAYTRAFRLAYHTIMPAVMRRAAKVITVSNAEKSQILRYYPASASRISVVPNGNAAGSGAAPDPELEALRPYVLYVGSFSKRKNFPAVLATARRLLQDNPKLRFVFVGGSPAVFNEVDLGTGGQSDRMVFAGQVDEPQQLFRFYRSAEALLFPSFYESSGLPPLEAMANGCPAVVSEIPALVERCGDAAVYCDPHQLDSIYGAVTGLLNDPGRRTDLVRKGLQRSALFDWSSCARSAMEIIEACAGRSAGSSASVTTEATNV